MKTQQELQLYYWGPHYNMVKEYNEKHGCDVKPYGCVKDTATGDVYCHDPVFVNNPDQYNFALTILYDDKRKEHRPVFVGDKVYDNILPQEMEVIDIDTLKWSHLKFKNLDWSKISWSPPTPKRTFTMEFTEEEMKFLTECHTAKISHMSMSEHINERARGLLAARDKE